MKNWRQFWGLCEHKWNIINEWEMREDGMKTGYKYILQCEKCGAVEKKRV